MDWSRRHGLKFAPDKYKLIHVVQYAVPWYCCCAVRCAMVLYAVPLVSSLWLQGSVYLISMVPLQPWYIYRAPHSIVSQSIIIHNSLLNKATEGAMLLVQDIRIRI